jgi:serine/threonine-protein kinase
VTEDAAPKVRRFGNFEILSLLGKGGMAEVYRAKVLSGPREGWIVALKRLLPQLGSDPAYVELFTSEANLSKSLDHPNIVKVLEVGVIKDVYYFVMDLVDGRDLGQVLRKCKQRGIPLPMDFAVYLAKVLLDALSYAHSAVGPNGRPLGIIHCDISPSNLFISRTGEIKLGDFGVARVRANPKHNADIIAGKPYYLSPEMLDGKVSPEVDLWAATVTLYELLTLERPFVGKTPDEVYDAVRARRYVSVRERRPEIPDALELIITRGFAAKREQRFKSAAEFAAALEPLFDPLVGTPLAIAAVVRGLFGA